MAQISSMIGSAAGGVAADFLTQRTKAGRILVQAPRDKPAVLVADLDLDQRRDWLELFPFLATRRPDAYGLLTQSLGR